MQQTGVLVLHLEDNMTTGPLNPPSWRGRAQFDHSTWSNALLCCRNPFIMRTFSASTLREDAQLGELTRCTEEREVEILRVQEHRRVHTEDDIRYCRVGRCSFVTSSAWRNEAQAATGGIGLLLSPRTGSKSPTLMEAQPQPSWLCARLQTWLLQRRPRSSMRT